jgi:hypothetical protein
MPLVHYPGIGYFIEPCKYCQEEGLIDQKTDEKLDKVYMEGYLDALSEMKKLLNNIQMNISDIDMDINSLLSDIDKKEKIKENE